MQFSRQICIGEPRRRAPIQFEDYRYQINLLLVVNLLLLHIKFPFTCEGQPCSVRQNKAQQTSAHFMRDMFNMEAKLKLFMWFYTIPQYVSFTTTNSLIYLRSHFVCSFIEIHLNTFFEHAHECISLQAHILGALFLCTPWAACC